MINGMTWLRGGTGELGPRSLNLHSFGMFPWMAQRVDPTMLQSDINQQYQAMLAAGLQNLGSEDLLKQQLMQFQQPVQYLQPSGSHNPLLQQQQQQVIQQTMSSHMLPAQMRILSDGLQRQPPQHTNNQTEQQAQQHTYQEAFPITNDHLQQRPLSNIPSPSFAKQDLADTNSKFVSPVSPSNMQSMMGSLCPEGSANLINFNRTGQSMLNEQQPQRSWMPKAHGQMSACSNSTSSPTYPGKDVSIQQESSGYDARNQVIFGANVDSLGLLLPTTLSNATTASVDADADMSSVPLGASGFQSSLYDYMQDSSELMHSAGQVDPPTPTSAFVKVPSLYP